MNYNLDNNIKIMGILNTTPDSFSDGGRYIEIDRALYHVGLMIKDGVDIIDIGGESSRPGSDEISLTEEIDRVIPLVEKIKSEFDVVISIDTTKSEVARISVAEYGADIINDISALNKDENMASVVSGLNVPIILMHMKGLPKNMQDKPFYKNVINEINSFFKERIQFALKKGIKKKNIILDPGIGFGKRLEDNINIIKNLSEFKKNGLPLLIGLSKKRFLGDLTEEQNPDERGIETVVANLISIKNGASIIRVHNVIETVKAMKIHYSLGGI